MKGVRRSNIMIKGKKVGNYQEIIELDNIELSKQHNMLWKTWKNQDDVTIFDVFKQLSYGHNIGDEYREYDAILRHELGVKILQYETEEENSNPYMLMYEPDVGVQYFRRNVGRKLSNYVFLYMDIVSKAFDEIALQYNTDNLTEIYPDLNYFNFRKILMPGEVDFVLERVFKGNGMKL